MSLWKMSKSLLAIVLCFCLLNSADARVTEIVTTGELHQDLLKSWNEREQDLAVIQQLLSTDSAREMISDTGADYNQVMEAIPNLSDEELSKLANQTRVAYANFAAGLSDREIINVLIIVLIVVAIVVIVVSVAD